MAIELNYTNNLTYYTGGYAKIVKYVDDATNRKATIQMGFFADAKDSHSDSRIVMVDEVTYEGEEYNEIVENYGVENSPSRKLAYEKIQVEYNEKWDNVSEIQNDVDGIERPYRDAVLKTKSEKDADFKTKGEAYEADPTPAKEAEAKASHKDVIEQQREYHDVMYGENNEYTDAPIKYSANFEKALTEIPES